MSVALRHYHGVSSNLRALQIRKLRDVSGRIIVVGDVHGCVRELDQMVEECKYDKSRDVLILVGDFVNKGYDSVGVVKRCIELGAYGVLGNHDFTLLHVADALDMGGYGSREQVLEQLAGSTKKKDDVLDLAMKMPPECMAYLRQLPHIIRIPQHNVIILHAGINVAVPLEQQDVFDVLHVRTLTEGRDGILRGSHGNTGTLWAEMYKGPEQIVFGHDARTGFRQYDHAIALDSGCVYGNSLTAVIYDAATPHKGVIQQIASKYNCKPLEIAKENVSPGDSPAPMVMNQHTISEEVRKGFTVDAVGTPVTITSRATPFASAPALSKPVPAMPAAVTSPPSLSSSTNNASSSPAVMASASSSSSSSLMLIKTTVKAFITANMLEALAVLSKTPEYGNHWETVVGSDGDGLGRTEWEGVLFKLFEAVHTMASGTNGSPMSPAASVTSNTEAKEEQLVASYLNLITDILDVRGAEAAEDMCDLANAACDAAKKKYTSLARLIKQVKLALP